MNKENASKAIAAEIIKAIRYFVYNFSSGTLPLSSYMTKPAIIYKKNTPID